VSDVVSLDKTVIGWLLGAGGAFILFLLGLGVSDIRNKMKKVDQLCLELRDLRADMRKEHAEIHGELGILGQRMDSEFDK
jgi:hypothetical protein